MGSNREVGTMSSVAALESLNPSLEFVSDSQDTCEIRFDFGPEWDGFEYDSYFVHAEDGEYKEIWGMCGIIPLRSKLVTRVA